MASPSRRRSQHDLADTTNHVLWAFDYDLVTGIPSSRRELRSYEPASNRPDGACVDAEGNVYVAIMAGGRVEKISPTGELLAVIELPIPNITCCTFAGDDLRTLYITTARTRMTDAELAAHPVCRRPVRVALAGWRRTGHHRTTLRRLVRVKQPPAENPHAPDQSLPLAAWQACLCHRRCHGHWRRAGGKLCRPGALVSFLDIDDDAANALRARLNAKERLRYWHCDIRDVAAPLRHHRHRRKDARWPS